MAVWKRLKAANGREKPSRRSSAVDGLSVRRVARANFNEARPRVAQTAGAASFFFPFVGRPGARQSSDPVSGKEFRG